MILLYSPNQTVRNCITSFLKTTTNDVIMVAETEKDIVELAKENRPKAILLHMPAKPGTARDIQSYLLGLLPHTRVRILPIIARTDQSPGEWQSVITKALRLRENGIGDQKMEQP